MKEAIKQHHPLYEELYSVVGSKYVTDDALALLAYTRGPSWARSKEQGIIVKPGNTKEVSEVVKLANRTLTPIVPRGGGASLAGYPEGAPGRGIVVDMTRMNKILFIDEENMVTGTECGITLSQFASDIRAKGLLMRTVDQPQYVDTVGGVLSGYMGGGGPADLATSGGLWHYVLGLEVVLPTGEVITTGSGQGTNIHLDRVIDRVSGTPDTTGLFIGDAGGFGIKTKAYFQILPFPTEFTYGMYIFKSFEEMWPVFLKLTCMGPYPYTRLICFFPKSLNLWSLFYVQRESTKEEVAIKTKMLDEVCREGGGEEASEELSAKILKVWGSRRMGKDYASRGKFLFFEYAARKTDYPDFIKRQREFLTNRLEEAGVADLVTERLEYLCGVQRDTILVGTVMFLDEAKVSAEQREKVLQLILDEEDHMLKGGYFPSGNQGFSTIHVSSVWSPTYHAFMKTLKKALDPNNIINPGLWRL